MSLSGFLTLTLWKRSTHSSNTRNSEKVFRSRKILRQILRKEDFGYVIWQEWKEEFARFIENRIRHRLGLPENHSSLKKSWNRTLFYDSGARFIEFLCAQEKGITGRYKSNVL